MENFKTKQDELQAKAAELQGVISTSYGRARDDAIKSLGEINEQLGNNAKAHEEATKRILFDIAAQQLATIQDPQIRAKAMSELAFQWGLVDKATYEATESIIGATAKLAADNNVNLFTANLKSIANKQLGIAPINIPVEPTLNTEALKTKPLPTVELPVVPKVNVAEVKAGKIEAVEVPIKKIEPPVITPRVDTTQAAKDIQSFTTDRIGGIPTEKKTLLIVDPSSAVNNTLKVMNLFGLIPRTKDTTINVDAKFALQALNDAVNLIGAIRDKEVTIKVNYETGGSPPEGFQHGGSYIVPPNPSGALGDYFPVLAAPGERVTVQTRTQQNADRTEARIPIGDTYNYITNVYNPLAAAMLADQQRRDRLARSNARMGVQ